MDQAPKCSLEGRPDSSMAPFLFLCLLVLLRASQTVVGLPFVVQLADETGNKLATTAYPYSPGELRKRASLMLGGAKLTLLIIIYSIRSLGDDVCDERRGDQHRGGRQRVNRAEWRRNDHGDPQPNRQVS